MKNLKNLLMLSLLGFALVACSSSDLEDQNWETFVSPNESVAVVAGTDHKLDDTGERSEDGLRLIGAPRDKVKSAAATDYTTITVKTKDGYKVGGLAAGDVVISDGVITSSEENTKIVINAATIVTENTSLDIDSEILTLEFFEAEDTEMTTVVGHFRLIL